MILEYDIYGNDFLKAGYATSEAKKILKQLNIEPSILRRIAIAMFEAEVNVVAHAYKGKMIIEIDEKKIKVIVDDEGPGIENIELAMQEGFSTASEKVREMGFGAGMGLPNIKKNADELKIDSIVGKGTNVQLVFYT